MIFSYNEAHKFTRKVNLVHNLGVVQCHGAIRNVGFITFNETTNYGRKDAEIHHHDSSNVVCTMKRDADGIVKILQALDGHEGLMRANTRVSGSFNLSNGKAGRGRT